MFAVNIALGNSVWRLLFKNEDTAKTAFEKIKGGNPNGIGTFELEDDFGQRLSAKIDAVHGLMFEDLDKAKMANVELFLHQQRVQAMAQKAAQNDPGLRANNLMNSPRMIDPMGGMPRQ